MQVYVFFGEESHRPEVYIIDFDAQNPPEAIDPEIPLFAGRCKKHIDAASRP